MTTDLVNKCCIDCGETKPFDSFYRSDTRSHSSGYRPECKQCGAKRNAAWRKANPEKVKGYNVKHNALARENGSYRNWHLQRNYGMTLTEYDQMYLAQDGACKICGDTSSKLHVDHCHDTGRVRGLLCFNCNQGLGQFKDNLERLRAAVRYLEE